jgi:hypothetical protein
MLASNLSDNSSVQIQSSTRDSTQVATNTLINTTQVMFNISTFSNTTEIDTTIQILINTSSSPPATTINTSNSLVNFFNSTTSNLTQIAPIIILHSIVQSTIQPTVQPITRKISKTTNKKISGLTALKINKNLATTSPRESMRFRHEFKNLKHILFFFKIYFIRHFKQIDSRVLNHHFRQIISSDFAL